MILDRVQAPATFCIIRQLNTNVSEATVTRSMVIANQIGNMSGVICLGFLIAFSIPLSFGLLASSFLFSFFGWSFLLRQSQNSRSLPKKELKEQPNQQSIITPTIINLYIGQAATFITVAAINSSISLYVLKILKMNASALGYIETGWAIGAIATGLIYPSIEKFLSKFVILLAPLLISFFFVCLYFSSNILLSVFLIIVLGSFFSLSRIMHDLALQKNSPDGKVGYLRGISITVISTSALFTYALVAATEHAGVHLLALLAFIFVIILSVIRFLKFRFLRPPLENAIV